MKRISICLVMIMVASAASAAVPHVFNYQGYVSELDGTPLNGNFDLDFRIYDVSSGVNPPLWTEIHPLVNVSEGVFSVLLGSLVDLPPAVLEEDALWVGVTVGFDTEIAPRMQVTSTPWAYRAAIADSAVVSGGGGGGSGTVTRIDAGVGLTGGPITTSGTLSVAEGGIIGEMLDVDIITSSNIVDGTIVEVDIATGGVASNEILDNSVQAADVLDEPGVAAVWSFGLVLSSTPASVASRQLFHPASGYVVAIASSNGYLDHSINSRSDITISISATSTSHNTQNDMVFGLPSTAATGKYRSSMSTTEVFPVTGSGIVTYYLIGNSEFGGNFNSVFGSNLVLMYFPTAYGTITKDGSESDISGD